MIRTLRMKYVFVFDRLKMISIDCMRNVKVSQFLTTKVGKLVLYHRYFSSDCN